MPTSTGMPARAAQAMPRLNSSVQEHERAERARREKFGEGRPAIHADFKGHKLVAVGNQPETAIDTSAASSRWQAS